MKTQEEEEKMEINELEEKTMKGAEEKSLGGIILGEIE